MVHYGYGKTRYLLEPSRMTSALKFSNFAVLVNGFAMASLKISIGLSLLRLQLGKGMVWIVWGSVVLSVVVNLLVLVTTLFGCRPLAAVWDRSLMPIATCLPRNVNVMHSYIQTGKLITASIVSIETDCVAVGNIVTDLFYSLSPLYYLSKVKVSVYNKWALRGVFTMGLLATVCAAAKCAELPQLGSTTDPTCKCNWLPYSNASDRYSLDMQTTEHESPYGSAPSSMRASSPPLFRPSSLCSRTLSGKSSVSDPNFAAPPMLRRRLAHAARGPFTREMTTR